MSLNVKNVSIYIKRAEMHHTKNYIINALCKNNYGKVSDVVFIKKTNDFGKEYNGAIVTFEKWFTNSNVTTLFNSINDSLDGTAKIIHDNYYNKYWIVNIHKKEVSSVVENVPIIDTSKLDDKEKITYLESLVASMTIQNQILKLTQEKSEKKMMEYEDKSSHEYLVNCELKIQLEEKDLLREIDKKNYENEKSELKSIIEKQNFRIDILETNLNKKRNECIGLKQDLYDEKCINNFVQEELYKLKTLIDKNPVSQVEII
jgi:hypothetical protein